MAKKSKTNKEMTNVKVNVPAVDVTIKNSVATVAADVMRLMKEANMLRESSFYLYDGFQGAEWTLGKPEMASSYRARAEAKDNHSSPKKDTYRVPVQHGVRQFNLSGYFLSNAIIVKDSEIFKDIPHVKDHEGIYLSTKVSLFGATRFHQIARTEDGSLALPQQLEVVGAVIDGQTLENGDEVPFIHYSKLRDYPRVMRAWLAEHKDSKKDPSYDELKSFLEKKQKSKAKAADFFKGLTLEPTEKDRMNRFNWFPTLLLKVVE